MDEKEILAKANELLQGKIIAKSIHNVNHVLGHPYTIGPKHIIHAFKHHGGSLGVSSIEEMEKAGPSCAHPGCRAYYHEHKSDRAMFLQLTCNLTNKETGDLLYPVRIQLLEPEKIDGLSFIETPEKYRIAEPIKEEE
jgi:hypothetical protein